MTLSTPTPNRWWCPDCDRVFKATIRAADGRYHDVGCDTPMRAVTVRLVADEPPERAA